MARTTESRGMSAQEDQLASLLVESGFSYRRAGEFIGRSGKAVKAACERVNRGSSNFSADQVKKVEKLLALLVWLDKGRKKGLISGLAAYLGNQE